MTFRFNGAVILLIFFFCALLGSSAQANYSTHYYTVAGGLSNNTVNCIYQDKAGYIWIGTNDGLNMFDGYSFRIFRNQPGNKNSINHNNILFIKEDHQGQLWIGTSTSLSLFHPSNSSFTNYFVNNDKQGYHFSESNNNHHRYTMFEIGDSGILYTSIGTGLLQINLVSKNAQLFQADNNCGKIINHILLLDKYILIGSSDAGLDLLSLSTKKTKHLRALHQKNISFMAPRDEQHIWLGSYGMGSGILDLNNDVFTTLPINDNSSEKFRRDNILCGLKSKQNGIYIGSESGLFTYNSAAQRYDYFADNSFFSSAPVVKEVTRCIFEDKDGNYWVGTYREGLIYMQKNTPGFSVLKDLQPSANGSMGYVNALLSDRSGIWIASGQRGLLHFNPSQKQFSTYNQGEAPYHLQSRELCFLMQHSDGKLWIGTANAGVMTYDPSTKKSKHFLFVPSDKNYNSGNQTMAILEDQAHNIWVATEGDGVQIIDPKTHNIRHLRHYPNKESIASNWVRSLALDAQGNIWIGTISGLSKYNPKNNKIVNFLASDRAQSTLKDNTITHILCDKQGRLWFATSKGLHLLENPYKNEKEYVFKYYSSQNGLINNTIHALVQDLNGNIWMSTNGGISMLNVAQQKFINYPFSDLPIDFFCEKSACITPSGLILFGGLQKLIYFDPDHIQAAPHNLQAQITELRLFNQVISPGDSINDRIVLKNPINTLDEIELKYAENVISFLLSSLYFNDPNGIEYSYKLDGFNKEWLHTSAGNRLVTYTHLAPGKYTFHVQVQNKSGHNIGKEKILLLSILPPWWRSNIAYLLYLVIFIFLLWLYRYFTFKQIHLKQEITLQKAAVEKQQELIDAKMEFYTNVSHEFKTPLTLIQGPIDKLIREDLQADRQNLYALMKQNTLRLRKYIDEILLFRKIQTNNQELKVSQQDFLHFLKPITDAFRFQTQNNNITFDVNCSEQSISAWFDEDKLEKILMNLLSNAIKYTPKNGAVALNIVCSDSGAKIAITVRDSGPGIPKNEQEKIFDEFYQSKANPSIEGIGIGLSLVKSLITLHKGSLSLRSEVGEGAAFKIILPISRDAYNSDEINAHKSNRAQYEKTEMLFTDPASSNIVKSEYKILIVDDNHDIRSFLKGELETRYHIIEAENGRKAIDIAIAERPNIIISDVMMPEMDGFELCKAIKTDEALCATPVLLLTAKTSEESVISGLEFGADDYIAKPFNIDILQIKVRNILRQMEVLKKRWKSIPEKSTEAEIAIPAIAAENNEFVQKLINAIETHIENVDLTPALLAQTVGISRTKLYAMVAEHTGYSVIDFIYIVRLRKAAEMLPSGKFTVSEVSWKVGFKQHSHFTKRFSEHFGKTPSSLIP
jgi:signal transduction histidine kinase/ligand-binding sensor domain-containing protein/DNA-binding response OmpR family regulator